MGEETAEKLADDGERITVGIVYRAGLSNPSNMIPRRKDAHGPQRGLSSHFDPVQALPPDAAEGKTYFVVEIDIGLLRHLRAYRESTGHVAFRPPTQAELEEWIRSRGEQEVHPLTQEIRDAVVGKRKVIR